ncbi:MAG TPA: polyprenol phosphomannose-dependent alpha 1,6 mannosyltransferase MptB [Pseudonocardiaceae bacterium]|nr:polyprenol phosphomannose-dependent alpha 1,6 mannosyltransferase MptB [Pseudonocardiaceae bacterium]
MTSPPVASAAPGLAVTGPSVSGPPARPEPLDADEVRRLDVVRRFGTMGSLLMGVAALGVGTAPVLDNPVVGRPVLGLLIRMPTASLAVAYTGIFMVVLAWLWLGALAVPGRRRLLSRAQLDRTLVMWAVPLLLAPPMFSRDVYSYLAQSAQAALGLNPYTIGPADAFGVDHPLVRGIPTVWRNTPAPYGPLFLVLGRPIVWIAGDDVVLGAILHRVFAVVGIVMIVWALPRLARRAGVCPVFALWLGAANPLVLFHLVSGVHNEALMIGLMLLGLELALRSAAAGPPVLVPLLVAGTVLISAAAMIKLPAVLALGFLGVWLARRQGGHLRDLLRTARVLGTVAAVTVGGISLGSGLGFGWLGTLSVPSTLRSWMSVSSDLGLLGGRIGMALGLGDHTTAVLTLTRTVGLVAAAAVCAGMLWRCFRGRIGPLAGLGVSLGAVVVLGPVVHPWYLLWAAIPLAAAATPAAFRIGATIGSVVLAVVVTPTGADFLFRAWVIPVAIVTALIALVVPLLVVRGRTPSALAVLGVPARSAPGGPT